MPPPAPDSPTPRPTEAASQRSRRASLAEIQIAGKAFTDPLTRQRRLILEHVHVALDAGELVAIVGPSGCGKTTLLQLIAGLDDDFEGSIQWTGCADGQRPRLGYVFQNPRLLPWLTLRRNIELVMDSGANQRQSVDDLLKSIGLRDSAEMHANRLSVGMQRRAALARAFAVRPRLLLMDEPFVSLDAPTARQLRLLLLDLLGRAGPTVIFVTHDLQEAAMLADRIIFLSTSPASILGETSVDIERSERQNLSLVDDRYAEIRARFDGLYG